MAETITETETDKKPSGGKKFLSAAFNIAAGAGAAWAAKTVATTLFASCLPAIGTVFFTSVAVGAAVATTSWAIKKYKAKQNKTTTPKFWSKDTGKTFLLSSAFALAGGALFTHLSGGFDSCTTTGATPVTGVDTDMTETITQTDQTSTTTNVDKPVLDTPEIIETQTEPPVVEDVAEIAPAAGGVSCGQAAQSFTSIVGDAETSSRVADSLSQAAKGNAQGIKDLGYFLFNGFDGVAENKEMAVQFFECAAEQGNTQAQVDLAYAQYHGLGTEATPAQALDAMKNIDGSSKADWFVQQWSGQSATAGMKP